MTSTAVPTAPPTAPRRLLHPDPVVRRLSWMVLVNTVGNGLFMAVSVLYFTRVTGLGVGRVGIGLTAAGLCGVVASIPAGRAADRWGSRRMLTVLCVVEAAGMASYVLVRGFAVFMVVVCLETAVDRASSTVRNTLYADALPKATRVQGRAYLRAVTNVGIGAGAAVAALALQADSRPAYDAVILVNAVTFAAVAAMLTRIPVTARGADVASAVRARESAGEGDAQDTAGAPPATRRGALRDAPYLAVTLLNALLTLQFAVLNVGIPLWVVRETDAPRVVVSAALILNTVLVVAFQVRATRATRDLRSAARACRASGLLLAGSCLVIAVTHGLPGGAAAAVLLAAVVLETAGEVLSQAGGWLLGYDLADPAATGAYQGVFNAGASAGMMAGPAVVTATAVDHGPLGWAVPAALFALSGAAMVPAVRWAEHRR
ncbi:MFS transporter [Actinacidiphila rubida]|uniref:Major Facilitator Superfamily protein n=1 Tax=Actinacidiphila rubida TaxID=310780 RepID=A0A1H8SQ86_9ACTN|nr:MFS transporter [Actinacidiphila rubida]SEO81109.1 Major Facilitator Superfamily protein [Actinacidiphila rubida]